MKVLLVDDEQKFITMLAKRLAFRGIHADVVFSGDEAIIKSMSTKHDVAILDIKMPGISGIQLKRELSSIDPDLKFIFVTGHGAVSSSEKEFIQKDIYLSKPLDIDILIKKIIEITKSG